MDPETGEYRPRDMVGLSFSELPSGVGSNPYAAGLSWEAVEQAGFEVIPDGGQIVLGERMPAGHITVRLRDPAAWNAWLYNKIGGWDALLSAMVQAVIPKPGGAPAPY